MPVAAAPTKPPVLRPLDPNAPYEIRPILNKGNGLIAIRKIKCGETIMSEAPYLRLANGTEHRKDFETSQLKLQIKKLPANVQSRIMSLHASHGYPNKHKLQDIFYTNCFGGIDGWKFMYCDICYINHSCKPNAQLVYDITKHRSNLKALRDIEVGEELLNDYRGATASRAERQQILKEKYGFDCDCERCNAPEEEIEARDAKIARLRELEALPNIPDRRTGLDVLRECAILYRELEIVGSAQCEFFIAGAALMCTLGLPDRGAALAQVAKELIKRYGLQGDQRWPEVRRLLDREEFKSTVLVVKGLIKRKDVWWIVDEEGDWSASGEPVNWAKWLWLSDEKDEAKA